MAAVGPAAAARAGGEGGGGGGGGRDLADGPRRQQPQQQLAEVWLGESDAVLAASLAGDAPADADLGEIERDMAELWPRCGRELRLQM